MHESVRFSPSPLFKGNVQPKTSAEDLSRRFWYRVSDAPTDIENLVSEAYSRVGCQLVYSHYNELWSRLRGSAFDEPLAAGEEAQGPSESGVLADIEFQGNHPVYSFSSDTVCEARAMQHCSAIEWLLIPTDGSRNLATLSPLVMNLPVDVINAKRLQQRVKVIRGGVHEEARVGVGSTLPSILQHMNVISELDIDYVSAIAPASLIAETHPAYAWVNEPVTEQVQKLIMLRKALSREDIAIVLQVPLKSGYDAAAYMKMGIETIVLNGWDCMGGTKASSSSSDAFASSFLGVSAQQHMLASHQRLIDDRVQHFFNEIEDFKAYIGE
jgi:hypothetical protein